jgi:hypothetical protein
MGFDNTDKKFAVKIFSLFIVLAIGIIIDKTQPSTRNPNQDIIKLENSKPSLIQTISVKKATSEQITSAYFNR